MALTPSLIGRVTFSNVTTASLSTGNIAVGTRLLIAVCINAAAFDDITDSKSNSGFNGQPPSGNSYGEAAGEAHPNGTASVTIVTCVTAVQLRGGGTNDHIILSRAGGMTGSMAAFSVTGLTAGVIDDSSSVFGTDTSPDVGLGPTPANDYVVGILGVAGPSTDGFTQDPTFANPGNFNTQTTTNFSTYAGFKQLAAENNNPQWKPTLGVVRDYVALLISLTP